MHPILPFLKRQGVLILDGGLATELEARGHDLAGELWSARLLLEDPAAIRRLHLDYLEAGADCVTGASYQASLQGFRRRGLGDGEAIALLARSVEIAAEARDAFWGDPSNRRGRLRPLVAASVGPYGAFLADGSEYSGDYDLDEEGLIDFHRRRFEVLAGSGADLLACETIPSRVEARALARLLDAPGIPAWLSFSCRDERRLADGSDLAETAAELEACERIVAVGVNCTAPRYVPGLIARLRGATDKPVAVYPNSGEAWDAAAKRWVGLVPPEGSQRNTAPLDLGEKSEEWRRAGARLIGGCCRTGPAHIRQIRERLLGA